MKRTISLIFAALIVFNTTIYAVGQDKKAVGIVAHRGFWNCEEAGFAKNSIAALRCAQEAGFWGREFDVNMTADSVLLVYHDNNIDGKKIEKHPYAEFKDCKIANGENIPTVDDYLEQGTRYPETVLVYELKSHSSAAVEDIFVDLTIAKLKEYNLLDPERVIFISFSFHICERLATMLPGFTVQFLGSGKNPDEVAAKGINGVDYNHQLFDIHKKWYRMARKNGMSVNAWTVNGEKAMKHMFRMGVDQLTTDNPLKARQLLKSLGYKEAK